MRWRPARWAAPLLAAALALAPDAIPAQRLAAQAAAALDRPVRLTLTDVPLADALDAIAAQAGVRITYSSGVVPVARRVSLRADGVPAAQALREALSGTGVQWRAAGAQVVLVAGARPAAQELGRIAGRVRDARTGEPLPGARVAVEGTALAAVTDPQGRYALARVPAGERALTVGRIGYQAKRVTGVRVPAGGVAEVDVTLGAEAIDVGALTVTVERERNTSRALLGERRVAAAVVDVVGRDQIDRSADSDAAEVIQRIPGAEIREGRYAVVRGLGERYGEVTLNGVALPSTDPNRKAVALDVIPAHLLEGVVVAKAFTPDQPGDFTGGLVQLRTRSVPTRRIVRVSTGLGYNAEASLRAGLAFPGCSGGWTGLSDCWRFPASLRDGEDIEGYNLNGSPPDETPRPAEERERLAEELAGSMPWEPVRRDLPLNRTFSATYGDAYGAFSFVAAGSWANRYDRRGDYRDAFARTFEGRPAYRGDYLMDEGTHEVSVGGSLGAGLLLGSAHRLSLTGLFNRQSEARGLVREGYYWSQDIDLQIPENRYVETSVWSALLQGDHVLGGATLGWRVARSGVGRYEPGSRRVIYTTRSTSSSAETGYVGAGEDPAWEFFNDRFSGEVLHQDLDEGLWTAALDLTLPLPRGLAAGAVKAGAALEDGTRDVITRRIRFFPASGLSRLPEEVGRLRPAELFVPANIGSAQGQLSVEEAGLDRDSYDATQRVAAGYVMADVELAPGVRLVGGARVERSEQEVDAIRLFGPSLGVGEVPGVEESTDWLPSAQLTWTVREGMNLRAGVARTVARPQLREIAPYAFQDFFGGYITEGNPRLRRSLIDNADLRWEWFPSAGGVLSLGVFGKRFYLPIEPVVYSEAQGSPTLRFINSRRAETYGVEVELRTGLDVVSPALAPFSATLNYTALRTEVDSVAFRIGDAVLRVPPEQRVIFGQTPYLLNVGLGYDHPRWGTELSLLFRRTGERLEVAPSNLAPAVYERPRSDLDAVLAQPLGRGLSVKLSAERLLGTAVRYEQTFPDGTTITPRRWNAGRTLSVQFTWDGSEGR